MVETELAPSRQESEELVEKLYELSSRAAGVPNKPLLLVGVEERGICSLSEIDENCGLVIAFALWNVAEGTFFSKLPSRKVYVRSSRQKFTLSS